MYPKRVLYWGMSPNIGGIEAFIINIYRNIDRSKVQIDFLTSHDKGKLAFEDEITKMGGRIYRVMYSESESFIKARTSLKNFFKEHNDYVAVHIHANFPYAFPLKYAQKAGIPIRILHSHNSGEDEKQKSGLKGIICGLRDRQIKKQIDKYPTDYFACSQLAADFMFKGKPYKWIKNGIDLSKYAFDKKVRQEVREELGADDDCHVLGFVGRLRRQKNPYFILEIYREYMKIHDNSKLILAGIGEWEDELKEAAKDLIAEKRVLFLGRRTDANRLYQGMDAFLLPSFYEGLPVVLVESQAAGLLSFTSDVVTRQVEVTDLLNYYSLDEDARTWALKIYEKISGYDRKDSSNQVRKAGFDIKSVALELERFYLQGAK